MADYVELFLDQGSDYSSIIVLNDPDTRSPINLVGANVISTIKKSVYSANISDSFAFANNDAANGNVTMSIAAANTSLMEPGRYYFDVSVTTGSFTKRSREGIITLNPGISGINEPGIWSATTS